MQLSSRSDEAFIAFGSTFYHVRIDLLACSDRPFSVFGTSFYHIHVHSYVLDCSADRKIGAVSVAVWPFVCLRAPSCLSGPTLPALPVPRLPPSLSEHHGFTLAEAIEIASSDSSRGHSHATSNICPIYSRSIPLFGPFCLLQSSFAAMQVSSSTATNERAVFNAELQTTRAGVFRAVEIPIRARSRDLTLFCCGCDVVLSLR